jgi:hypothetical protein
VERGREAARRSGLGKYCQAHWRAGCSGYQATSCPDLYCWNERKQMDELKKQAFGWGVIFSET